MTIIAYKDGTIAADRRVSIGCLKTQTTKIFRTPEGGLVGASGNGPILRAMIEWAVKGMLDNEYPECAKENDSDMLYIAPDRKIWLYSTNRFGLRIEAPYHAIGGGSEFAMAAMYLGKTAVEAVEVANALSPCCGEGVDRLDYDR